jgi:16S rRNA processing protein RimM
MTYKCNILLGKIIKVNVINGTVTLKTTTPFVNDIPDMETVFVEIDGRPVPFFISELSSQGNDLLSLKLTDYDTADKIKEFKGCRVFLTSGDTLKSHNDNYEDLTGFSVFDENGNEIGTINNIIQNPRQWLLSISSVKKKDILLPLHEDLIIRIDDAKRIITVKIPEGLLEIN